MTTGADPIDQPAETRVVARLLPSLVAAVVALTAVCWRLGLWHYDLRVPLVYWGDALYETALIKRLTESHWNYYIDRLGAPFGMAAVDYPLAALLISQS